MSESYWRQPLRWNKAAVRADERKRVFCASMADVFEDHPGVVEWRKRLFGLIEETLNLDWLLLTKRPENMNRFAPESWRSGWPTNVIAMASVEDQQRANERIPYLLRVPARRRGLSCEPLLSAIDLSHYLIDDWTRIGDDVHWHEHPPIAWVIVGGESGCGARPMKLEWALSLRDQCQAAGIPFFFKQFGEYLPDGQRRPPLTTSDPIRELMRGVNERNLYRFADGTTAMRVGKHAAGRLLDGREWSEYPELTEVAQ